MTRQTRRQKEIRRVFRRTHKRRSVYVSPVASGMFVALERKLKTLGLALSAGGNTLTITAANRGLCWYREHKDSSSEKQEKGSAMLGFDGAKLTEILERKRTPDEIVDGYSSAIAREIEKEFPGSLVTRHGAELTVTLCGEFPQVTHHLIK